MKGLKTCICFAIVILSALAFVLTSCGGGGGSSTGGGGVVPSLTNANAPQAGSAAGQSLAIVQSTSFASFFDLSGNVGAASISSKTSKSYSKSLLKKVLNKAVSISKTRIHIAGSMPTTTVDCFDSGTLTISNAKWTDNPDDPSDLIDLSATITATACKEEPYTWNGSMTIALVGSSYAPTKITTVSTPGFTSIDSETNETFTMTNLTTVIDYFSSDVLEETITLTGTISGQVDGAPINLECKNFKIDMIDDETVSLSGDIKPTCLGFFVTVTTNTPIVTVLGDDCPTAGEIVLTSGANKVKIVIAADSKISIYYNDTLVQTYNSCTNITGLCGA